MREDAADLGLEVGHRFLVVHVQHLARQHLVPVPHRLVVLAVVGREIVHVVGEVLALAEQLLVAAETAVERVPAGVDDPRVRQDQVQQPDVREVVGQLVGEVRPVGGPVGLGLVHVLATVGLEVLAAQVGDGFRIALLVRAIAADRVRQPHQHRQFGRALDLAVARENLLDQCRSRARQADDEDRGGGVAALPGVLGEQLGREHCRDLLVAQLHRDRDRGTPCLRWR